METMRKTFDPSAPQDTWRRSRVDLAAVSRKNSMKLLLALVVTLSGSVAASLALAQVDVKSVPLPPLSASSSEQQQPSADSLAWAQKHVASWPEKTRRLAAQLVTKYGVPAEATERQITWYANGPWKRTTLHKEEVPHNFANAHKDV